MPLDYSKMDEYNKEQEKIAQWVRGKLMIRQAEQAREVARYYQHKNLKLQPGSLVWLNKRATNVLDGDVVVARNWPGNGAARSFTSRLSTTAWGRSLARIRASRRAGQSEYTYPNSGYTGTRKPIRDSTLICLSPAIWA